MRMHPAPPMEVPVVEVVGATHRAEAGTAAARPHPQLRLGVPAMPMLQAPHKVVQAEVSNGRGGNGGNATSAASATASGGNSATALSYATAGAGGSGFSSFPPGPANGTAGTANATSSATAVGPGQASAQAVVSGARRTGPGNRTDQFRKFHIGSIYVHKPRWWDGQSHRPVGSCLLPTRSLLGRVFVVSGSGFGPLTVANGSMGAGYGGINGISFTYQESASFTQTGGAFVLDLLSSDALGSGFDSALFRSW